MLGSEYTLTCTVNELYDGLTNTPTAQWMDARNGVITGPEDNNDRTVVSILTFTPLTTSHAGHYTCHGELNTTALNRPLDGQSTQVISVQSKLTHSIVQY